MTFLIYLATCIGIMVWAGLSDRWWEGTLIIVVASFAAYLLDPDTNKRK